MQVINPCKKCLVKACCTQACDESYKHLKFRIQVQNIFTFIPYTIKTIFQFLYEETIALYKHNDIFSKVILAILVIEGVTFTALIFKLLRSMYEVH